MDRLEVLSYEVRGHLGVEAWGSRRSFNSICTRWGKWVWKFCELWTEALRRRRRTYFMVRHRI